MELVVLLGVVVAIIVAATPIAAFIAVARTRALGRELRKVRNELGALRRGMRKLEGEGADSHPSEHRAPVEEAGVHEPPATTRPPVHARRAPVTTPPPEATPPPSAGAAGAPSSHVGADHERSPRSTTTAREPERRPASVQVGGDARTAVDFETVIGTTWLLRIGLGILGIALALFAREVVPQLPAAAKVALAYGGAIALFLTGKVFEAKLERFARPVMAAGLTFGFFVAFAAHFVPAMRAVSLPVSIVWMVVSMIAVLIAAERWTSQVTGALALVLGHVSVLVAAGQADIYSLVMIVSLAATAVALVLRHEWSGLGLFAVAVSYGSHLLWLLTERDPISGELGFWLNLAFLTSYYVVFLIGDVLWWRRDLERDVDDLTDGQVRNARQIGPANVVLYVGLASFVYIATGAGLEAIEWFFLTLGVAQGALAWFYWGVRHRDFSFYPAFGTVLWTLGMFAALDALALNLVLAAQALLLLLAAHQTKLWVFHALAQVGLAVAFVHYLVYPVPSPSTLGLLLGGLGIAAVYLLKASLEEVWYGEATDEEWTGDVGGRPSRLSEAMSEGFARVAPFLAPLHAALGGLVLLREVIRHYGLGREAAVALVAAQAVVALLALFRRRPALLFSVTALALAAPYLTTSHDDALATLLLLDGYALMAVGLVWLGRGRMRSGRVDHAAWHAQSVIALALLGGFAALRTLEIDSTVYLLALTLPLLVFLHQELLRRGETQSTGEEATPSLLSTVSVLACLAAALAVVFLTVVGYEGLVVGPVWIAVWASAVALVSAWRRSSQLVVAGYTLLAAGYANLLATDPVFSSEVLATPWAGLVVAGVPMLFALAMDRSVARVAQEERAVHPLASPATYGMYGMGLFLVAALAHHQLPLGWSFVAPAALAVGLAALADRARVAHVVPLAVVLLMGLHAYATSLSVAGPALETLLVPLLVLCTVTWGGERVLDARAGVPPDPARARVHLVLVAIATWTAMVAIYQSEQLGTQWVTAGWSVLGVALMIAGFALRSSVYRRVALTVLGVSLVRVFAVDTRGLSDTERTVAFFVLGVCLVGAAWLYARFSEELKSWL